MTEQLLLLLHEYHSNQISRSTVGIHHLISRRFDAASNQGNFSSFHRTIPDYLCPPLSIGKKSDQFNHVIFFQKETISANVPLKPILVPAIGRY